MIFIAGVKAVSTTVGEGTFHCPDEGGDRTYRLRSARRWFTLFFIPIIPLQSLGEYIECASCSSTFTSDVLVQPTTARIEDVLTTAVRHAVVSVIKADGEVHPREHRVAIDVVREFSDGTYGESELHHDLATLDDTGLEHHLVEVGGILDGLGKEALLAACVRLAGADGAVTAAELALVHRAGRALSMSPAHIRGVVDTAVERLNL